MQRLLAKPAFGNTGEKYKELLHYIVSNADSIPLHPEWNECFKIIHESVTEDIGEHKILMPSVLMNSLIKNNENFLSDVEQRKRLCGLLNICVVVDESVVRRDALLNLFVSDYTSMLVIEIFKYYSRCLRSNVQQSVDKPVELDQEDKETIHFVGGFVVRSFYKKSKSFQGNVGWKKIGKLIVEKLLESDTVPGPPAIVKQWTISQDRGKLFFISGLLYDFFCGVTEILEKTCRNKLVRVDAGNVIESVCHGCAVLLWDEAVGDSLSEKASYDLMCGMVRSFCTTYAVGKSKNLINDIRKTKAEASIALRAKVAPKS